MKHVDRFTIDRATWLRGERAWDAKGNSTSSLLRSDDRNRCCLGFYLGACGIEDEELEDLGSPTELTTYAQAAAPPWMFAESGPDRTQVSSSAVRRLISVNDNNNLPEPERERRVAELFDTQGITVEFTRGES